jgi:NAD(P)-dependent dehydrogenase (short-subunit alcohol dehydrogenase family)
MPSVLISGASRGIGLEFARQYKAAGWHVIATCRAPKKAAALAALGVEVHALDVADINAIGQLARGLKGVPLDVLINNAGLYGEHDTLGRLDAEEWQRIMLVNAIAPLKVAEAFLPAIEAGGRKIMVFLTSQMGSIASIQSGGAYSYRSSKAALNAGARTLAMDVKSRGIAVVVLHPGWVRTDMGGRGAPISPEASVTGLRRVIDSVTPARSGSFFDYTGQRLPW